MDKQKEHLIHNNNVSSENANKKLDIALQIDNKSQPIATPRKCDSSETEHRANKNISYKLQPVSVKIQCTLENNDNNINIKLPTCVK